MAQTDTDSSDLDETDLRLLEYVEQDYDVNLDTLSDELDLSNSAIHYRLNKLKDSGIIQGVTADLDPNPFGLDMVAITDVFVTHEQGYSENVGTELAAIDGVEQVYYTMGDVDFIVISRVQNRDQIHEVIEQMVAIENVNETSSRFVMSEVKSNPQVMTNLSAERQDSLLQDDD